MLQYRKILSYHVGLKFRKNSLIFIIVNVNCRTNWFQVEHRLHIHTKVSHHILMLPFKAGRLLCVLWLWSLPLMHYNECFFTGRLWYRLLPSCNALDSQLELLIAISEACVSGVRQFGWVDLVLNLNIVPWCVWGKRKCIHPFTSLASTRLPCNSNFPVIHCKSKQNIFMHCSKMTSFILNPHLTWSAPQ